MSKEEKKTQSGRLIDVFANIKQDKGVIARFNSPDSPISIGLSDKAIADIKHLERLQRRAATRVKDFRLA